MPHQPAAWRRPPLDPGPQQRADPGALQGDTTAPLSVPLSARPDPHQGAPIGQSRQSAAEASWPAMPVRDQTEQLRTTPQERAGFAPPPPHMRGGDPEWLAAHLQREAARHDEPRWNGIWRRRLVTWGLAGVLLAAASAGALWLYEESRVEGALGVVANTSPAPAVPAPRSAVGPAPVPAPAPALDAVRPLPPPATVEQATTAPAAQAAPPASLARGEESLEEVRVEEGRKGAGAETPAAQESAPAPVVRRAQPRRERVHVRTTAAASRPVRSETGERAAGGRANEAAAGAPAIGDPAARQRREETRLQCEAHGYDAEQCLRRRCEMTSYGLACKG